MKKKKPLVGIIMGSDSDLEIMKESAKVLSEFGIPFEITIVSAHRTPERLFEYCKCADERGLRVLIAGAGGAAHLPGMAASLSPLPVIGVPIKSGKSIEGIDSLLSIVQMPPGVPVATVAVDGARNAGVLAAQILAVSEGPLMKKIRRFKQDLAGNVMDKVGIIEKIGYEKYLKQKKKKGV